jgi:hypothetical protein
VGVSRLLLALLPFVRVEQSLNSSFVFLLINLFYAGLTSLSMLFLAQLT